MSLEESIVTLTNTVETMTTKLEQLIQTTEALRSLRADAIETVKNTAAAPTEKKTRATKSAEPEPQPETEPEVETKEEVQEPTADTLSDAVKEYIGIAGNDGDRRKQLAAKVKEIFGKVKATKRSEVPKDKEAAVEKAIRKLIDEVTAAENEDADDEDLI